MESPHSSRSSYRHETLWRAEEIYRQRGRSLEPVIDAMRVWGEAHMAELIIEEEATYKQN